MDDKEVHNENEKEVVGGGLASHTENEKEVVGGASHNEKMVNDNLADTTARKGSVALNIIRNPLQVSNNQNWLKMTPLLTTFHYIARFQRGSCHERACFCRDEWHG